MCPQVDPTRKKQKALPDREEGAEEPEEGAEEPEVEAAPTRGPLAVMQIEDAMRVEKGSILNFFKSSARAGYESAMVTEDPSVLRSNLDVAEAVLEVNVAVEFDDGTKDATMMLYGRQAVPWEVNQAGLCWMHRSCAVKPYLGTQRAFRTWGVTAPMPPFSCEVDEALIDSLPVYAASFGQALVDAKLRDMISSADFVCTASAVCGGPAMRDLVMVGKTAIVCLGSVIPLEMQKMSGGISDALCLNSTRTLGVVYELRGSGFERKLWTLLSSEKGQGGRHVAFNGEPAPARI